MISIVNRCPAPETPNADVCMYELRVGNGRRGDLRVHLTRQGIGTGVYYPVPLHRQRAFATGQRLREVELASGEVLSLPIFPEMTDEQQQIVIDEVRGFYE